MCIAFTQVGSSEAKMASCKVPAVSKVKIPKLPPPSFKLPLNESYSCKEGVDRAANYQVSLYWSLFNDLEAEAQWQTLITFLDVS